jgi:hypothetical protein
MACISKAALIKLQKSHKTDAAIGLTVNVSRQAVHQLRVKYGIKAILDKNADRNKKIHRLY